jgi:signal transduction histidine kinase
MARSLQQNQEDLGRKNVEIEGFNEELRAKNAEIERFNVELQARVDRRTAQLRAAQASLVQSRQLAAVAELSAGLTHELNNPLAGVVGLLQVLKARAGGEDPMLDAAEREALRCTEIVGRLGRFTQGPSGPRDGSEHDDVDVHLLLSDLLSLLAGGLRERQITVHHEPGILHVRGEESALGRALGQLVAAVRTLASEGSTLDIRSEGRDLVVTIEPVRASLDDWRAASLGFWAARQVFEEHGAIVEEPRERVGLVRWVVRFPGGEP